MNPIQRAALAVARWTGAMPDKKVPAKRAFNAAQVATTTSSWLTFPLHVNYDLQRGLRALRARSRDLAINNDHARKFLSMVETNVVGHAGFTLQCKPLQPNGRVDTVDAQALENAFADWGKPGNCEITGHLSWTAVQRLFIRTVARDGECLVRRIADGPYGYRLQLVDPQQLDEWYSDDLTNGNKVRMSVEYTPEGAPVAFYLACVDTADPRAVYSVAKGVRVRVPAEEIRLFFLPEMIGQLRGTPWMTSAMVRLKMLGAYEEAEVTAARVAASKMGFFTDSADGAVYMGDDTDANGNIIGEVEPGTFERLPPGVDFKAFDPQHPGAQFSDFVKACLRSLSSGLGVSYSTFSNDLESVNYSSIRAGSLEEREVWKGIQNWMAESFLDWVYHDWLRFALLKGAIKGPSGAGLPASRYDKFAAVRWAGRRWEWVDPEKDMQARILAVQHGFTSRAAIVAEQGRDLQEVWEELRREQEMAKAMGINLLDMQPQAPAAPPPAPAGNDQTQKG